MQDFECYECNPEDATRQTLYINADVYRAYSEGRLWDRVENHSIMDIPVSSCRLGPFLL